MSIVIIGGNERMVFQYKDICKQYNCKAKVFAKMVSDLKNQIGRPDLIILFTSTVSHKLVKTALIEASSKQIAIERLHSSSASALKGILQEYSSCSSCTN